jgi:hypothetical protein
MRNCDKDNLVTVNNAIFGLDKYHNISTKSGVDKKNIQKPPQDDIKVDFPVLLEANLSLGIPELVVGTQKGTKT